MREMKVEPRIVVFDTTVGKATDLKNKVDAANAELQSGIDGGKFAKAALPEAKKALKRGMAISKSLEKVVQA